MNKPKKIKKVNLVAFEDDYKQLQKILIDRGISVSEWLRQQIRKTIEEVRDTNEWGE